MASLDVPIELRKLRSEMVMLGLSVREVSERTGIAYTTVSSILNGRIIHPQNLAKIRTLIEHERKFLENAKDAPDATDVALIQKPT